MWIRSATPRSSHARRHLDAMSAGDGRDRHARYGSEIAERVRPMLEAVSADKVQGTGRDIRRREQGPLTPDAGAHTLWSLIGASRRGSRGASPFSNTPERPADRAGFKR